MAANPFTVVTNDARTTRLTGAQRHEMQEVQGSPSREGKVFFDEVGTLKIVGRGESNPLITYSAHFNSNNVLCYIYPNAAGNGIVVTTVKP